jgi:hypothetical protein
MRPKQDIDLVEFRPGAGLFMNACPIPGETDRF